MHYAKLLISVAVSLNCLCARRTEEPATRPTTQGAPQSKLRAIELHYATYLSREDIRTTITPEGMLRTVRIENKSYGPKDADPKTERIEVRAGQLKARQMAELEKCFVDWESLATARYGGVADGGEIEIRYGNKKVCGGSATPPQVWRAFEFVGQLAAKMPVIKP